MDRPNPRAGKLRRLSTTLQADRQSVSLLCEAVEETLRHWSTTPPSKLELAGLALTLHNVYTAVEHALQIIAETLDGATYRGEAWHRELLLAMGVAVPGVRDQVLAPDTLRALDELRGFRHVVRHAYEYELNADRVRTLAQQTLDMRLLLDQDMKHLMQDLERRMAEVEGR